MVTNIDGGGFMNQKCKEIFCQIDEQKAEPVTRRASEIIWIQTKDTLRKIKQNISKLRAVMGRLIGKSEVPVVIPKNEKSLNLKEGDRVQVKSAMEIEKTLDQNGKFQGCAFTKEMLPFCEQEMIVFKTVNMFLNETNNKIQRISNTVLLENAYCTGQRSFGEACDRSCFLFWKEVWLKKI